MHVRPVAFAVLIGILLTACPSKKDGHIEGTVSPPGPNVRISAMQRNSSAGSAEADARSGRFRITLAPGSYDISVTAPPSPFPLVFPGVIVRSGETTQLGPITLIAKPEGTAVIRGRILTAGADTSVTLLADGFERASVRADAAGSYVFERLPPGTYTIQVRSSGYANDSRSVTVPDGQQVTADIRMIYVTLLEGVDWERGVIRVRGVGLPPLQAPTPTVRREMAKRAALADAERNLLRVIEIVQIAPGKTLQAMLGEKAFTERLLGFLRDYRIVSDRDLDGGRVEIELELPLTGPAGLTSYLRDR
jgi:hypothetical protein